MRKILYTYILSITLFGCNDFKKSIKDTLDTNVVPISTSTVNTQAHRTSNSYKEYERKPHKIEQQNKIKTVVPLASQPDQLEEAEEKLRNLSQFKGKSIFIYKLIHFYEDGRIVVTLQNPENPKFIDEYTFKDSQWQFPKPIVLSKKDNVKNNLVNLEKLPFKNSNNVYKVLLKKRKEIGSTSKDYIIYAWIEENKINWYPISINNDRSVYNIEYYQDGTLKSFKLR